MKKSTLIALVVFLALAAGVALTQQGRPRRGITQVSFTTVNVDGIDRVDVAGEKPIELRKENGKWTLPNGKRADAGAVTRMLDSIARVESSDLVTENPDRFADLEVTEEKGAAIKAFASGVSIAEFTLGKGARDGSYLRIRDSVYLVPRVYRGAFQRDESGWLERKLFADDLNSVDEIEVKVAGEDPYTLVKDGTDWVTGDGTKVPDDFRFDRSAARTLASSLVGAQAKDILDDAPDVAQAGLGDEADVLTFYVAGDSAPRTLRLGKDAERSTVYAKASSFEKTLTVPAYLAENLRKRFEDLRNLSLMDFDAAAATRLELRNGDEHLLFAKVDGEWRLEESSKKEENFELDPNQVAKRIAEVSRLRGVAFAEDDGASLAEPSASVTITSAGDEPLVLAFGKETKWEDQDAVIAAGNADGRRYVVQARARDNVLRGLDSFRRQASPAGALGNLDPESLKGLPPEVRDSLMQKIAEEKKKEEMLKALQNRAGGG
jgi:hypothetical protein